MRRRNTSRRDEIAVHDLGPPEALREYLVRNQSDFDRITIDPNQMRGVPCIRGLRIPVATVLGQLAAGVTSEAILDDFPDLEPDDIPAALEYAAAAVQERELPLTRLA
jgi:uncharacterized protein (DUF433 family)